MPGLSLQPSFQYASIPLTLLAYLFTVTRIQFYAVEIARNRRGLNKHFLEKSASTEDSHER